MVMGNVRQIYYYYDEEETPESGIDEDSRPPSPDTLVSLNAIAAVIDAHGRDRISITCPFCKMQVKVL